MSRLVIFLFLMQTNLYALEDLEFDFVKQIQYNLRDLSKMTNPKTDPECHSEYRKVSSFIKYEKCTEKNNYLEADLLNNNLFHFIQNNKNKNINLDLCIFESMKLATKPKYKFARSWSRNKHYVYCAEGKNKNQFKKTIFDRPCLSKNYHQLVSQSFQHAVKCVELDPISLLKLIHHESQFRTLVGNSKKVYGIMQLTSQGIAEVHRRLKIGKKTRPTFMKNNYLKNAYCQNILKFLVPAKVKKTGKRYFTNACERTKIPPNPLLSLIYGGLIHKLNKRTVENKIQVLRGRFPSLEKYKKELQDDLAVIMYNGGAMGTLNRFESFLMEYAPTFKQNNYAEIMNQFSNYLAKYYGGNRTLKTRKKEVANYLFSTEKDYRIINEKVKRKYPGRQCTEA